MKQFYIHKCYDEDMREPEMIEIILFNNYISNKASSTDIFSFCNVLEKDFVERAAGKSPLSYYGLIRQMTILLKEKDKEDNFRLRDKRQLFFNALFHSLQQENCKL